VATNLGYLVSISGGGSQNLASVLGIGAETGGNNIIVSSSDSIRGEDNPAGSGFNLVLHGGAPGGGGAINGGSIVLNPASGSGGGTDGQVLINGNLTVTGDVTFDLFVSGTGSPEGVIVADIGAIYKRTDGGAGNTVYYKQGFGGGSTGWVPAGPHLTVEFTAPGAVAVFMTSKDVFTDPVTLGISTLRVYWNGVLQREGATEDFVFSAPDTITFNTAPLTGDLVTIVYLPA
jgi:hypothetical protein